MVGHTTPSGSDLFNLLQVFYGTGIRSVLTPERLDREIARQGWIFGSIDRVSTLPTVAVCTRTTKGLEWFEAVGYEVHLPLIYLWLFAALPSVTLTEAKHFMRRTLEWVRDQKPEMGVSFP